MTWVLACFTVTDGLIEGTVNGLTAGINEIKVTENNTSKTVQFIYSESNLPDGADHLLTDPTYNTALQSKYNTENHNTMINKAKELGYENGIVAPVEFNHQEGMSILHAFIMSADQQKGPAVILSFNNGGFDSVFLMVEKNDCEIEIFSENNSTSVDLCRSFLASSAQDSILFQNNYLIQSDFLFQTASCTSSQKLTCVNAALACLGIGVTIATCVASGAGAGLALGACIAGIMVVSATCGVGADQCIQGCGCTYLNLECL